MSGYKQNFVHAISCMPKPSRWLLIGKLSAITAKVKVPTSETTASTGIALADTGGLLTPVVFEAQQRSVQ